MPVKPKNGTPKIDGRLRHVRALRRSGVINSPQKEILLRHIIQLSRRLDQVAEDPDFDVLRYTRAFKQLRDALNSIGLDAAKSAGKGKPANLLQMLEDE
jgi:hypothetical protein